MKNFTRIVAPFDGLVTARGTDIGALINVGSGVGQELFEVSRTDTLRVYVNVPQTYVPSIPPGTKARITVPERPGKVYAAAVAASAQAVNIASGATLMQILVDNANGELLPGAFANISFDLPHNFEVLSIPASALMFDKAGLRVATVGPDSRVILKAVTIMRDLGKLIELSSGLAPTIASLKLRRMVLPRVISCASLIPRKRLVARRVRPTVAKATTEGGNSATHTGRWLSLHAVATFHLPG